MRGKGLETVRLYKFCEAQWGLDNLWKRRLKISRISELNDPFEFNPFALQKKEDRKVWAETLKELENKSGIISFSESWDNPVIWSHYAESHKGICLGFDVRMDLPEKVEYVSDRKGISPLSAVVGSDDFEALRGMTATKYAHWEYEKEWRIILGLGSVEIQDSHLP